MTGCRKSQQCKLLRGFNLSRVARVDRMARIRNSALRAPDANSHRNSALRAPDANSQTRTKTCPHWLRYSKASSLFFDEKS